MKKPAIFKPKTFLPWLFISIAGSLIAICVGLCIGQENLDWFSIVSLDANSPSYIIFFKLRLPEVLLAFVVGGGLTIAGILFQSLLQNPLASPYTLGVASGAGFGAVLSISLPTGFTFHALERSLIQDSTSLYDWFIHFIGFSQTSLFALAGGLFAIFIVYFLGQKGRIGLSTFHLLLAGVTLSFVFGGMMLFIQYLAEPYKTDRMIRWLMADLEISNYKTLIFQACFVFIIYIFIFRHLHTLNIISLGAEMGQSRGVDIRKYYRYFFFLASLLTAMLVSVTGPIAFVGLIIPHLLRILVGHDHRILVPTGVLAGGSFLVLCDLLSRVLLFWFGIESKLPVGVITALIGGPIFILMLRNQRSM